jgi:hypothetical protein
MHADQLTALASAAATRGPAPAGQGAAGADPPAHQSDHSALAALFDTSQSAVNRVLHHLVPMLARALRPIPSDSNQPWIIDGTLIPVRD